MPLLQSSSFDTMRGAWSALALALLLGAGCRGDSGARTPADHPRAGALTDRIWVRSDSTGLPGVMRAFLSDSTLVMDSCWETYRLARWQMESDTTLHWQEDASEIRATIRTLNDTALVLLVSLRDGSEEQHYTAAPVPYVCPDMKQSAGAWRALGTEPFWALDIDGRGLRFRTPDDTGGILWPAPGAAITGDTLRWTGETERGAIEARIWPARCSDGMSDRVWHHKARVGVEGTAYRGCAESREGLRRDTARPPP